MIGIPFSLGVVHFVGIGGIGMSGIAEVMHRLGCSVRGSDIVESANVLRLKKLGIEVFIGQTAENIQDASVVVVSTDIPLHNPEYQEALRLGIPVVRRAQMLGELMRWKYGISVAGTHGKTTTTSMIATLLDVARFDPTVVSGGIINSYGTNARLGEGEWMVVEADESDGTFVYLPSALSIVTNIDLEHMVYYKTEENLMNSFESFLGKLPFWGTAIVCSDHPRNQELVKRVRSTHICTYGLNEGADIRGLNVEMESSGSRFDVEIKEKNGDTRRIEGVFLPMVGAYNVQNALAVVCVAQQLKISDMLLKQSLAGFGGVKRRFTNVGSFQNAMVIDDYAHHPVEISSVLKAASTVAKRNVVAVFQPHRYTRLESLYEDFKHSFVDADQVFVTPVYSAGEAEIPGINHVTFVQDLTHQNVQAVSSVSELSSMLSGKVAEGDLIVFLGAGSITQWAQELGEMG